MDESQNTPATIALVSGGIAMVAQLGWCCLGIIPFIGLMIQMIVVVGGVVAVVAGVMGLNRASETETGRGAAMGGLVMGGGALLVQIALIVSMLALGGLSVVLSVLLG